MHIFIFTLSTLAFGMVALAADSGNKNYTVTSAVTFNVKIQNEDGQEEEEGQFVVGLFGETCPMTTLNFKSIAKGKSKGPKTLKYAKSNIHRIVKDFIIQMGDITVRDGTGGESIFGAQFDDENFILSHKAGGYVSMANQGKNTNNSQFFIILNRQRWLDGKHVVFGKVLIGMDFVRKIGEVPTDSDTGVPKGKVTITGCTVQELERGYDLTEKQSESSDDIKDFKKYLNPKKK